MAKRVTLAVAGSRKTQGIVEHCAGLPAARRVLALTYTQKNQQELQDRLSRYAGDHLNTEVLGWFTFLLRHFAKPFLPFMFPGEKVRGFNFEGMPYRMAKGKARFLDKGGAVYRSELGRLAFELITASRGALIRRLEGIYNEILIDEVQDLSAYDWDILDALLNSSIEIWMVGDIRQAVLATNGRSSKNKKYAYADAIDWFRTREKKGLIAICESTITWRCHPQIAAFSDLIFDPSWGFPGTVSKNETVTGHDGVYLIHSEHVAAYVSTYGPQTLRHSAASAKGLDLDFMNFKVAKGATFARVLIAPTSPITNFIRSGASMEPLAASSFYVAVTRAEQSVAIVLDDPGDSKLPYWTPPLIACLESEPSPRMLPAVFGATDSVLEESPNLFTGGYRRKPLSCRLTFLSAVELKQVVPTLPCAAGYRWLVGAMIGGPNEMVAGQIDAGGGLCNRGHAHPVRSFQCLVRRSMGTDGHAVPIRAQTRAHGGPKKKGLACAKPLI